MADALRWQATPIGLNSTTGVHDGRAIRGNAIQFPGATASTPVDISDDDVATMLPFGNHLGVVQEVSIADLLLTLEKAVSRSAPATRAAGKADSEVHRTPSPCAGNRSVSV